MMLPPNAGRVMFNNFVSGSISSFVQSAVKPVWILAETRGAKSLPIEEAPKITISGSFALITAVTAFAYGSVTYSASIGSSTTITLSAPAFAKSPAAASTPEPIRTATTSCPKSSASSLAFPTNS